MTYTVTGPFTNGGAPGISATFLNNVENWIESVDNPAGTVLNGSTSGTATLYQVLNGTSKYIIVNLNNFRNGGGSTQTIALPVPFTAVVSVRSTDAPAFQLLHTAAAITLFIITALAVGGGTVNGTGNVMGAYSFAQGGACETLSFNSGQVTPHTGLIILEGI